MGSSRCCVAIVIKDVLDSEVPGKVMLVNCKHFDKTNSTTIAHVFDRTMTQFGGIEHCNVPKGIERYNVLLLVSDAKPYTVKAGSKHFT